MSSEVCQLVLSVSATKLSLEVLPLKNLRKNHPIAKKRMAVPKRHIKICVSKYDMV